MNGSAEILTSNGAISTGIVLNVASVDDVPLALRYGQSLTDITPVIPPRAGVDAEWTAITGDGWPAVVLWRITRDLTIQEIAAAIDAAADAGGD